MSQKPGSLWIHVLSQVLTRWARAARGRCGAAGDFPSAVQEGLADSKRLTERRREQLAEEIKQPPYVGRWGDSRRNRFDQYSAGLARLRRAVEGLSIHGSRVGGW